MNKREMLLTQAMEEASEVIQALSKCLRFGFLDVYEDKTNARKLTEEFMDLVAVMSMLEENTGLKLLIPKDADILIDKKIDKVEKWMKYSEETGHLT